MSTRILDLSDIETFLRYVASIVIPNDVTFG